MMVKPKNKVVVRSVDEKGVPFSSSDSSDNEAEVVVNEERPPITWSTIRNAGVTKKRLLPRQLSMKETTREAKWEKRRMQVMQRQQSMKESVAKNGWHPNKASDGKCGDLGNNNNNNNDGGRENKLNERVQTLTDEDLEELRGSIELGFGFDEESGGQDLCNTLPALDLYFAVKRQFSDPKLRLSFGRASSSSSTICTNTPSPRSSPNSEHQEGPALPHSNFADSWKIFTPGDDPQHVKTRLRHWAQVVACSVKQLH